MRFCSLLALVVACGGGDDDSMRCASPADCAADEVCVNGACVPAEADAGRDAARDAGVDAGDDAGDDAGQDVGPTDAGADRVDVSPDTFDGGPLSCPGPGGLRNEPIALYTFDAPDDATVVTDRAPGSPDVPLAANEGAFTIDTASSRAILRGGRLGADQAASDELVSELVAAGSFAVEVWFQEDDVIAGGPARIVTLSLDGGERAFTIGQSTTDLSVRFTASTTLPNGIFCDEPTVGDANPPSSNFSIPGVMDGATPKHVVLSFDAGEGEPKIYVNGVQVGDPWPCRPAVLDWATGLYRFGLGDEFIDSRVWSGFIHRVTVYARAMSPDEASCWHAMGPEADVFL